MNSEYKLIQFIEELDSLKEHRTIKRLITTIRYKNESRISDNSKRFTGSRFVEDGDDMKAVRALLYPTVPMNIYESDTERLTLKISLDHSSYKVRFLLQVEYVGYM